MPTVEYSIPEQNLSWIRTKIEKLNKTAGKLNVAPIILEKLADEDRFFVEKPDEVSGKPYLVPVERTKTDAGNLIRIVFVTVRVTGEAPTLNGWKFIGTLQHVEEGGDTMTILRSVPGESIPEKYRGAPNWCDHCKTNRVRNDTFIVVKVEPDFRVMSDPVGTMKQVGRNCLRDFLGHADPHKLADWAESLGLLDELFRNAGREFSGTREDRVYPVEVFLSFVAEAISRFGWVSKTRARELEIKAKAEEIPWGQVLTATVYVALDALGSGPMGGSWRPGLPSIELAQQALEWSRTELQEKARKQDASDYIYNLSVVARLDLLDFRMLGIAASLISTYKREIERYVGWEERAGRSKHFGEVGKREDLVLRVVEMRGITYSNGGGGVVVRFEDSTGNEATWFTGPPGRFILGKVYRVKATVRRHDSYKGVAQTVLNRVQIMEELG